MPERKSSPKGKAAIGGRKPVFSEEEERKKKLLGLRLSDDADIGVIDTLTLPNTFSLRKSQNAYLKQVFPSGFILKDKNRFLPPKFERSHLLRRNEGEISLGYSSDTLTSSADIATTTRDETLMVRLPKSEYISSTSIDDSVVSESIQPQQWQLQDQLEMEMNLRKSTKASVSSFSNKASDNGKMIDFIPLTKQTQQGIPQQSDFDGPINENGDAYANVAGAYYNASKGHHVPTDAPITRPLREEETGISGKAMPISHLQPTDSRSHWWSKMAAEPPPTTFTRKDPGTTKFPVVFQEPPAFPLLPSKHSRHGTISGMSDFSLQSHFDYDKWLQEFDGSIPGTEPQINDSPSKSSPSSPASNRRINSRSTRQNVVSLSPRSSSLSEEQRPPQPLPDNFILHIHQFKDFIKSSNVLSALEYRAMNVHMEFPLVALREMLLQEAGGGSADVGTKTEKNVLDSDVIFADHTVGDGNNKKIPRGGIQKRNGVGGGSGGETNLNRGGDNYNSSKKGDNAAEVFYYHSEQLSWRPLIREVDWEQAKLHSQSTREPLKVMYTFNREDDFSEAVRQQTGQIKDPYRTQTGTTTASTNFEETTSSSLKNTAEDAVQALISNGLTGQQDDNAPYSQPVSRSRTNNTRQVHTSSSRAFFLPPRPDIRVQNTETAFPTPGPNKEKLDAWARILEQKLLKTRWL